MQTWRGDHFLISNLVSMPGLVLSPLSPHWTPEFKFQGTAPGCCQDRAIRAHLPGLGFQRAEAVEERKGKSPTWYRISLRPDATASFFSLSFPYYGVSLRNFAKGRQFLSCEAAVAKDLVLGNPLTSIRSAPTQNHGHSGAGERDSAEGKVGEKHVFQVVGVGSKVPAIFKFCRDSALLPSAGFWVVSQDCSAILQFDQSPQRRGIADHTSSNIINTQKFFPQVATKINGCFFLVGAGSTVDLGTATSLLKEAQKQSRLVVSIVVLPFQFEGQKRRKEAEEAMAVLRTSSNLLIVVEQDALLQQKMVTVSEADLLACSAVLQGIKAISDLLLGPDPVKLDLTLKGRRDCKRSEVYQMLLQGGKACVGFGRGKSVKAALEAASLDSPFIQGWLAEEQGPVLCTVASAGQITSTEVEESLWLLRCLVGPKLQLVCTPIQEPGLDPGVISATIIVTGLNSIGTCTPVPAIRPDTPIQKFSASKQSNPGNTEKTWTRLRLPAPMGLADHSQSATSEAVGNITNSSILPEENDTQGLLQSTCMSQGRTQGNGVLSFEVHDSSRASEVADSISDSKLDQSSVKDQETIVDGVGTSVQELSYDAKRPAVSASNTITGSKNGVWANAKDFTGKGNHTPHKSRTTERLNGRTPRWRSQVAASEPTSAQRNIFVEKGTTLVGTGRKSILTSKISSATQEGRPGTRQAQSLSVESTKSYTKSTEIPWRAGPSSAVAEAWAQSRADARKRLVTVNSGEAAQPLNGEGAFGIHLGIRPRNEQQQRVVIPRQNVPMEAVPVDPAAVPRSGMGFLLDVYNSMLRGIDKGEVRYTDETLVQTSLSQRAASMLESERSRKKLTPVMEMEFNKGIYKGRCLAGLPDGKGRLTYKDGSFYEGQWKQGKREGNGTLYCANGDVFQGVWKEDIKHGKGWLYFHNGDRLYADYVNGKANGEGRLYFTEGDVFFGQFRDNWRHGDCLYIEASGVRWREVWEYGTLLSKALSGKGPSQTASL